MAINAYISSPAPINAYIAGQTAATAETNEKIIVPKDYDWTAVKNKPFETVDGETLSTEGGVLRFKTGSYNDLTDKPSIEGVKLVDDKSFEELGMEECSILDIEKMFA